MAVPLPSPHSLAHRARLATLIAQLRPTKFRAPLTRLEAHRIPTLWTLYRGIMRDSPTNTIRSHMRDFFRARKSIRAQGEVTRELARAYNRWDVFRRAREGEAHAQSVCSRYDKMIENDILQRRADRVYHEELAWYERMQHRPIMTGAYHKPSLFNKPLPRLSPQPVHITGMISARRKARANRIARQELLQENLALLESERKFEMRLAKNSADVGVLSELVYSDAYAQWRDPIYQDLRELSKSFELEKERLNTPYTPEMLEQIKAARREKVANKTRERERERRGEMTNRLAKQMRKSPPAHVLVKMSDKRRHMDAVARGVSEVGYVGEVKRALGFRLRDQEAWKAELGKPENQEVLDRMAQEIEEENARRQVDSAESGDHGKDP